MKNGLSSVAHMTARPNALAAAPTGAAIRAAHPIPARIVRWMPKSCAYRCLFEGIQVGRSEFRFPVGYDYTVANPYIDTEMNGNLSEEDKAALAEETPLERIGTARDVAEAIWFLVSPAGDFLTGQVLAPNGGFVI